MTRLSLTAETPEDLVARTAEAVGALGGTEFEFGYTATDRELDEDEDLRPDEPARWYVKAVVRRKQRGRKATLTTYEAHRDTPSFTEGHAQAMFYACVDLLEQLGVNVAVVDMTDMSDPRDR